MKTKIGKLINLTISLFMLIALVGTQIPLIQAYAEESIGIIVSTEINEDLTSAAIVVNTESNDETEIESITLVEKSEVIEGNEAIFNVEENGFYTIEVSYSTKDEAGEKIYSLKTQSVEINELMSETGEEVETQDVQPIAMNDFQIWRNTGSELENTGLAFSQLQEAIDNANENDVIRTNVSVYQIDETNKIDITKSITIETDPDFLIANGQPTILIRAENNTQLIKVTGQNVTLTINNLIVDGNKATFPNNAMNLIYMYGSNLNLRGITEIRNNINKNATGSATETSTISYAGPVGHGTASNLITDDVKIHSNEDKHNILYVSIARIEISGNAEISNNIIYEDISYSGIIHSNDSEILLKNTAKIIDNETPKVINLQTIGFNYTGKLESRLTLLDQVKMENNSNTSGVSIKVNDKSHVELLSEDAVVENAIYLASATSNIYVGEIGSQIYQVEVAPALFSNGKVIVQPHSSIENASIYVNNFEGINVRERGYMISKASPNIVLKQIVSTPNHRIIEFLHNGGGFSDNNSAFEAMGGRVEPFSSNAVIIVPQGATGLIFPKVNNYGRNIFDYWALKNDDGTETPITPEELSNLIMDVNMTFVARYRVDNSIYLTTTSTNGTITEWMLKGDANRDGIVNKEDSDLILRADVGLENIVDPFAVESADVNNDGTIDTHDTVTINQIMNGNLAIPNQFINFRTINTPNANHEVTSITVNGTSLAIPAKGGRATTGVYTVEVDINGVTTVTGLAQDYTNNIVFMNDVIKPVVTPSAPPASNTPPTPEAGRTCQDDGYANDYYWNGTACVTDRMETPIVNNANQVKPNQPNQPIEESKIEDEKVMTPVIDTVTETPEAKLPEIEIENENMTPQVAIPVDLGGWPLVNVLMTGVIVLLALISFVSKKKKEELSVFEGVEVISMYKRSSVYSILISIVSIGLLIFLFVTSNFSLNMILVNEWTPIFIAVIILATILFLFSLRWKEVSE